MIGVDFSRLCNEEDELSEVTESDVVPGQVKDWLTSTFTRSLTNVRRRSVDRLHFRSVANAIRAGIVVDRFKEPNIQQFILNFRIYSLVDVT